MLLFLFIYPKFFSTKNIPTIKNYQILHPTQTARQFLCATFSFQQFSKQKRNTPKETPIFRKRTCNSAKPRRFFFHPTTAKRPSQGVTRSKETCDSRLRKWWNVAEIHLQGGRWFTLRSSPCTHFLKFKVCWRQLVLFVPA